MSNLETIAEAKIQAAVDRRLLALNTTVLAAKQEMNSRGLLRSSMTVQKIHAACIALFDSVRDDIKAEYAIVLEESLWPGNGLPERLIARAREHLDKVAERAESEISHATQPLLNNRIHVSLNKDIPLARNRALTDLSLFIDGHRKVKLNRLIKAGFTFIPDLISRLFGGKGRER